MKKLLMLVGVGALIGAWLGTAQADIKYISGYSRGDGTYVSGHYRDTSNDGYSYNNANTLGLNNRSRPEGIY